MSCDGTHRAFDAFPGAPRCAFVVAFTALICFSVAAQAQIELSREDRLAILYTPQLQFAANGEPLIKIGLAEGVDAIRFSADTAFSVLPLGEGGAEIVVPADQELTVRISDGQAGRYAFSVVVAELVPEEREQAATLLEEWESRGFDVSIEQVGSIFAVSGQRFDTRKTLLTVGESHDRTEAQRLAERLSREHGIDARVHAELEDYPGGMISIEGLPGGTLVRHRDLVWIRGSDDTAFTIHDVPYDRWMGGEREETRRYVGALVFTADWDGRLSVVNEITLERLVEGILPAELYPDTPDAAMRAQAVAARSEVLADLGVRHLAAPYMTCSDQRCQMYRGIDYERPRESRAAQETRGQVLAYGDQIIKAYYSSNNGGFAGSNAWTWGEEQRPYLRARPDGPAPSPSHVDGLDERELASFLDSPPESWSRIPRAASTFRWTRTYSGDALTEAVVRRYPDVGRVRSVEVHERDPSGRVVRLRVRGDDGAVTIERELNVRLALGVERPLPSALMLFEVEHTESGHVAEIRIRGGGFGHGVGMCQSGAVGMANQGHDYEAILENYYRGAQLRTLYR